jgi:hypothetical protein
LHDAAFELVAQPIRIDDLAAVMRDMEALDCKRAGLAIDFDLGDRADISAHQLVMHAGLARVP